MQKRISKWLLIKDNINHKHESLMIVIKVLSNCHFNVSLLCIKFNQNRIQNDMKHIPTHHLEFLITRKVITVRLRKFHNELKQKISMQLHLSG